MHEGYDVDILSLPFNEFLGLQLIEIDGGQVVCLDPQSHHQNHLGTVHAGAVYSVAEAASGQALLQQVDLKLDEVVAVVRSATVKYRRPATGKLVAVGNIPDAAVEQLLTQLKEKGRGFVDVPVRVASDGDDVLTAEFKWFVTRA